MIRNDWHTCQLLRQLAYSKGTLSFLVLDGITTIRVESVCPVKLHVRWTRLSRETVMPKEARDESERQDQCESSGSRVRWRKLTEHHTIHEEKHGTTTRGKERSAEAEKSIRNTCRRSDVFLFRFVPACGPQPGTAPTECPVLYTTSGLLSRTPSLCLFFPLLFFPLFISKDTRLPLPNWKSSHDHVTRWFTTRVLTSFLSLRLFLLIFLYFFPVPATVTNRESWWNTWTR